MILLLLACNAPVETASYLSVLSVSPPHGASQVALDAEVRAVFSERLDEGALNVDHVGLLDASGAELVATMSYDDEARMLRLVPPDGLPADSQVTLVLSQGLPAIGVDALSSEVRATFHTAGEVEVPVDTGQDTGEQPVDDTGA